MRNPVAIGTTAILAAASLAFAAGTVSVIGAPAEIRATEGDVPRMVLAFYYPWYGNPKVAG